MNYLIIKQKVLKIFKEVAESRSKTFFFICASFILGVGIASGIIKNSDFTFYLFCISVIFGILSFYFWNPPAGGKKSRLIFLCGLFLILGIWRYSSVLISNTEDEIKFYNNQTINLIGVVVEEPDIRENHIKLTIDSEQLIVNRENKKVFGRVLVKIPKYPEYQYGDRLNIVCKLETPQVFDDFDYAKYLSRDYIYSLCNYPKSIQVLDGGGGNFIIANIFKTKYKFAETLNKIFPEPHSSFLGGLLYGERRGIPPDIQEEFRKTGVTHIIAISGYNITIVIGIFFGFLSVIWIPRQYAFWITLVGISLFTILTGAEASVVRAAIMGFVVLSAKQIGRPSQAANVLALSAGIMLLHNPKLLIFDVGFQLSFAATLGLVYIGPILKKHFKKVVSPLGIKDTLLETLAAILATLPFILFYFGAASLVAPFANVAILLFIPWVMFFGFAAGIAGLIWLPFGQIIGIIAWAILTYILKIINLLSNIPFASIDLGKAPFLFLPICYGILIYWIVWEKRKKVETQYLASKKAETQDIASLQKKGEIDKEADEFEIVEKV